MAKRNKTKEPVNPAPARIQYVEDNSEIASLRIELRIALEKLLTDRPFYAQGHRLVRKRFADLTKLYDWLVEFRTSTTGESATDAKRGYAPWNNFSKEECLRLLLILQGPSSNTIPDHPDADGFHSAMDEHVFGSQSNNPSWEKGEDGLPVPSKRAERLPYEVYADFLQEQNDPRVEGYRAIAELQRRPFLARGVREDPHSEVSAFWYLVQDMEYLNYLPTRVDPDSDLPSDWFNALENVVVGNHLIDKRAGIEEIRFIEKHNSTRVARDALARSWLLMTFAEQQETRRLIQGMRLEEERIIKG